MSDEVNTTVFVECVSCGAELVIAEVDVDDRLAARMAQRQGWSVKGFYGARRTRCRRCRRERRRDTRAADAGLIGRKSGGQTSGRARR